MRLIDADAAKVDIRKDCPNCTVNGSSFCKTECIINLRCDSLDEQPTIARTDKPLAIINDKVIYMTDGHVNALLEYEHKQAVQIVADQMIRNIIELQTWENEHGKK